MDGVRRTAPRRRPVAGRGGSILRAMKRLRAILLVAGLACHAAAGQGGNELPSLGDASSRLISPEMERQLGEEFLKRVQATLPTVEDPILKY